MRPCAPGEGGSVISRYNKIGQHDWIAMPPAAYLFATDSTPALPDWTSKEDLDRIRDSYRQQHLMRLTAHAKGDAWVQLVGASYRRRIYCLRVHTTPAQDARLMHWLNRRKNHTHFNFFFSNCADFTRQMLNVLYPHAIHRNLIFDFEMTTPRQLAAALHHYAERHPELDFRISVIPQIPGETGRSGRLYGVTESFAKTKYYLYPLAIIQPIGIGAVVACGFADRRYSIYTEPDPDISSRYQPTYVSADQAEADAAPGPGPVTATD